MRFDNGAGWASHHRTGAVVASAAALTLTLTGCGFVNSASTDDAAVDTLTLAVSTEQAKGLEDLIPKFEEESGISVKMTSASGSDLNQQLVVQLTSGTAPDIFRVSPGVSSAMGASLLGSSGKILALSEQPWVSEVPDTTRDLARAGDDIYGFPVSTNQIVMAYNKEVFDELDLSVPTTWSEFLDACAALKEAEVTPIAAGFSGGVFMQYLVYQIAASNVYAANPQILEEQEGSETAFSSSMEWRKVFEKLKSLQDTGYFTDGANGVSADQATQDLQSGSAAMMSTVSASLAALSSEDTTSIGVFALPGTDDPSETRVPIAPNFLAVNAATKNADGAMKFLAFLAEPENVTAFAEATASVTGLDVGAELPDQLSGVATELSQGATVPLANYTWPNGDTQQTLLQSGQEFLSGAISVDELLQQLDAQFAKGTP